MLKINTYPAKEGDALLVRLGNDEINIIIDMGYDVTYQDYMKKDLESLRAKSKKINLMVITHVDQDHILGAINFLEENNKKDKIIDIDEVWFNSFRHLQFDKIYKPLDHDEFQILSSICNQNKYRKKIDGLHDITVEQGTTLAKLLYEGSYNWNSLFKDQAVLYSREDYRVKINDEASIILISPDIDKLKILAKKWKDKLESEKYGFTINDDKIFDDAFELFIKENEIEYFNQDISRKDDLDFNKLIEIEEKDKSPTNGSSIAFILEYKDFKILFLGDAHEDIIYERLSDLKIKGYDLKFDLIKVSHHGSNKNISNRLLQIIECEKFLILTDGSHHKHPDLSTVAKIAYNFKYPHIITNYVHPKIEEFKKVAKNNGHDFNLETLNEIVFE